MDKEETRDMILGALFVVLALAEAVFVISIFH